MIAKVDKSFELLSYTVFCNFCPENSKILKFDDSVLDSARKHLAPPAE